MKKAKQNDVRPVEVYVVEDGDMEVVRAAAASFEHMEDALNEARETYKTLNKIYERLLSIRGATKPHLRCPQCHNESLKRCESTEQSGSCPSWRCLDCNLKFIVTNPSYLKS